MAESLPEASNPNTFSLPAIITYLPYGTLLQSLLHRTNHRILQSFKSLTESIDDHPQYQRFPMHRGRVVLVPNPQTLPRETGDSIKIYIPRGSPPNSLDSTKISSCQTLVLTYPHIQVQLTLQNTFQRTKLNTLRKPLTINLKVPQPYQYTKNGHGVGKCPHASPEKESSNCSHD
jgi:hypothetical protein